MRTETTQSKNFKTHPIAILTYLKPFLFVLLIPLLKAGVQFLADRKADNIIISETVTAILITVYALLKYRHFLLRIEGDTLYMRFGVVVSRQVKIKIKKISSVELTRNPLDYLFSAATVKINTEAGRKGRADYSFKLSLNAARQLKDITSDEENEQKIAIKFSPVKIALAAAATSSTTTGIIIAVPIIWRAGKLLDMAIEDMLLKEINNVSNRFSGHIPPIVNAITIISLFFYLISFIYTFFKSTGFKLVLKNKTIDISSGFFVRKNISLKKSAINSVSIEQTPIMQLLKKSLLRVEISGYGGAKGETATVIPASENYNIKREAQLMFPQFKFLCSEEEFQSDEKTKSYPVRTGERRRSLFRLLTIPFYWLAVVLIAYPLLSGVFVPFADLVAFLTVICIGIIGYRFFLCFYNHKNGQMFFGDVVYACYSKGIKTRRMYCDAKKIGMITITEYPIDRKAKTCKVKIRMRSESSDYMSVKCISAEKIKKQIAKVYNL